MTRMALERPSRNLAVRMSLHFVFLFVCMSLCVAEVAQAQLFGERTLGRSLRRQDAPQPVGSNEGPQLRSLNPERFVRGQRSASDFVGVQENAAQEFVGADQVVPAAAIRSAIDASVPRPPARRASQINRPLPPTPRTGVYPPRYQTAFTDSRPPDAPDAEERAESRVHRLQNVLEQQVEAEVDVLLDGRTVVLEGVVDSDRQRRLAELMAGFEPGVDRVVNRLRITPRDNIP